MAVGSSLSLLLRLWVLIGFFISATARLAWLKKPLKMDLFSSGVQPWGLPCLEPVKKAPVKFPRHLVVGKYDHPMYSGYVNVTARDYIFYWFAEAQPTASPDAPLIVWSNGGPGCSAMEGMTTEHGPLVLYGVKEDVALFAGRLSTNPYAWNKNAHVLYVDQPRYVGFSCGTGPFVTSSHEAGQDMVTFIRGWRLLFPEHAHRNIVLTTESYGGHYIPAWSSAILDYNSQASTHDPIRVQGIAIGNGIVDDRIQGISFPEFAVKEGLLPSNSSWPIPRTNRGARELMKEFLGYQPNYYDYRLKEQDCCGCSSYNYKAWADWMLREDVTKALNVCGNSGIKAFANCAAGCINLPDFDKSDNFDYLGALGQALQAGIKVTLYYGMQDTACDYVGGYAMARNLQWHGSADFATAPFKPLLLGEHNVPTGQVKAAAGLTWVQVEGAGHMVPINNPAAAAFALNTLLQPEAQTTAEDRRTKSSETVCPSCSSHQEISDAANKDGVSYLQRLYRNASRPKLHSTRGPAVLLVTGLGFLSLSACFLLRRGHSEHNAHSACPTVMTTTSAGEGRARSPTRKGCMSPTKVRPSEHPRDSLLADAEPVEEHESEGMSE